MIKYFKPGVFFLSTIPFLFIFYKIYFNKLGPEPVKEITHFTGNGL
jgi:sulfoxide reductase heme-binding subunit YedZ